MSCIWFVDTLSHLSAVPTVGIVLISGQKLGQLMISHLSVYSFWKLCFGGVIPQNHHIRSHSETFIPCFLCGIVYKSKTIISFCVLIFDG